jgi:hypothetical protein
MLGFTGDVAFLQPHRLPIGSVGRPLMAGMGREGRKGRVGVSDGGG